MLKNIRVVLALLFICGIAYPLLITGLSQVMMPAHAEGSLIKNEKGQIIGSELIGQSFEEAGYFHGVFLPQVMTQQAQVRQTMHLQMKK